jgi:elongation factor G
MASKDKVVHDLAKVRNLGIIAHIDAGKTTTSEHILFYSGATHRLGAVDKGNTTTDWNEEEQERGITIYSACIPFTWRDCTVNLIDTPGHVDFTAEVERSLRVLDGCIVVFDAQKGVEAQSETVWHQADKYRVPRLVFINKMDVVGANFENAVTEVRERLDGHPVVLVLPIGAGGAADSHKPFAGVIDLLEQKALYFDPADQGQTIRAEPIPEDMELDVLAWREKLFDALTANDESDHITSAILEGKEVPLETLRAVIREQTLGMKIQPVLCGSGRNDIGIQPLLDAATYYLPSPLDRPPVVGTNPKKKDKEEKRKCDPKEPFCGLVFKVVADRNAELFYLRIYSGTLKSQSRVTNAGKDTKELISKIYHTMADPTQRVELSEAVAGDIVALIGLRDSITGDTLCETAHPIVLEKISFAEAVVSQSIEPESSADKDKLVDVLNILKKEDPTFSWRDDRETGQKLMSGMGTLHLEIKRHRIERDFKLKVRIGKPRVSYRETIKNPITVEADAGHLAGMANQVARAVVKFEPHHGSEAVRVFNRLAPESLPENLQTALEQGIRSSLDSGEVGYPVINVQATILSATMQEGLSTDAAFEAAGSDAGRQAMRNNSVLLEPVMRLEVAVPDEYLGAITGDLNARRAEIIGQTQRGKLYVVEAIVALARMFDYADKVRSLSAGRASYTMEPKEYRPAPDEVLRKMLDPFAD